MLTLSRFQRRSLLHYVRNHGAVALGVAAATAVLTGALIVGDSVRNSLQRLVLDRLGRIDDQLITDRFFREELLTETAAHPDFAQTYAEKATAIVLPGGTLEAAGQATTQRAGSVLVIGADDDFWNLGQDASRPARLPTADEIILNRPLADDLQVSVGDRVLLRLPKSNQVPADSPLG
ncbi:MAG: ABC transporter permease, partial [Planctomycetota bacterium]